MSTPTLKILHEWTITLERTVDETTDEIRNGQTVKVTAPVKKAVSTRMALKQPTRRELRAAELFYGKRFNWYLNEGFLPSSILTNKHLNLTGGIISDKDRDRIDTLRSRSVAIENDLVRAVNETAAVKEALHKDLANVRSELLNLYSVNQTVFNQTADKRAERDLNDWFAYHLTLIDRGGWQAYFPGDTYEKKEAAMWELEEADDPFYAAAIDKISTFVQFFNMGLNTPEQFKAAEDELKKQLDASKPATTPATTPEPAAAPAGEPTP